MRFHTLPGARTYPGILRPANRADAARNRSATPAAAQPTQPLPCEAPAPVAASGPAASPFVRRVAANNAIDLAYVTGTGVGGRITASDVRQAASDRLSAIYAQSGGAQASDEQRLYNRLFGPADPAASFSAADSALYDRLFGTDDKQS